jgi:hypothetical protein
MRYMVSAVCVSVLFFMLSLTPSAEGQEVKALGVKGMSELLAASKGKVVMLDFWASF